MGVGNSNLRLKDEDIYGDNNILMSVAPESKEYFPWKYARPKCEVKKWIQYGKV